MRSRVLPLLLMLVGCSQTSTPTPDQAQAAIKPGELVLTSEMEQRAGIQVTAVARRTLTNQTQFSSTIEAPMNRSGVVTAPIAGIVTRVLVDVGQTVKPGQVVAYLSSPTLADAEAAYFTAQAKIQEAQAQIQLAQGQVGLAQADLARESALAAKGISSVRERQIAEARLNSTRSELVAAKSLFSAAQSNRAAAQARLRALGVGTGGITAELPLRAPVGGVVSQRRIQPGQGVNPASEHLFVISGQGEVWAMLEVPQSEVTLLQLGAPVQFTSEVAPNKVFRGRVVRLGENFDAQARTVEVRAAIANPQGILKPGMLVLAQALSGSTSPAVLAVPNEALQQLDNKDVVFVRTAPQHYKLQQVQIGRKTPTFSEVKGLAEGANVVSAGSFVLKSETLKASLGGE